MKKLYKNDALEAIHETAVGLYESGIIDKKTMKDFDQSCLTTVREFTGAEIKELRKRERVSQTIFAHYLNVTKDYVSKWERDEKRPAGTALKLLSLVARRGLASIA
jgi:putative transcriptional regulator